MCYEAKPNVAFPFPNQTLKKKVILQTMLNSLMGENMKKRANRTKLKVLSKDCIFHMVVFYWFILYFSSSFKN
jgi:hypothetical protein